jgi:hypothetical protein
MNNIPEFKEKIGRNTPCPCGSKKKYKICHGHHSNVPEQNIYQAAAEARGLSRKSECFAPSVLLCECSKGTINAHTVSRSGSLGVIQRNGHVYSYNMNILAIHKAGGRLRPEATGWKQASTFPGFCGVHDKQLFRPLEDALLRHLKNSVFLSRTVHLRANFIRK